MSGYADVRLGPWPAEVGDGPDAVDACQDAAPLPWPAMECELCHQPVRWGVLWSWMAPLPGDEDEPRDAFVEPDPRPGGDYRVWLYLPNRDRSVYWPLLVPALTGGPAWDRHRCPLAAKAPDDHLVAR